MGLSGWHRVLHATSLSTCKILGFGMSQAPRSGSCAFKVCVLVIRACSAPLIISRASFVPQFLAPLTPTAHPWPATPPACSSPTPILCTATSRPPSSHRRWVWLARMLRATQNCSYACPHVCMFGFSPQLHLALLLTTPHHMKIVIAAENLEQLKRCNIMRKALVTPYTHSAIQTCTQHSAHTDARRYAHSTWTPSVLDE